MSAVKIKMPEDNITTFLTMRSHFKKIYDVRPTVNCWSEACPSKRLLKNTINIRNFHVLPHYCNSTISSAAKKSKKQNYDDNKLTRPLPCKKKHTNQNLRYDSAYDDDFEFGSVENNSRAYSSEIAHTKDKKKKKDFQNTMDESYQRFLEEMTNEVVRLDLCTDAALKAVFQKHIKHNIGKLDEKKMLVEVKKIQTLLNLPSDNEDISCLH